MAADYDRVRLIKHLLTTGKSLGGSNFDSIHQFSVSFESFGYITKLIARLCLDFIFFFINMLKK